MASSAQRYPTILTITLTLALATGCATAPNSKLTERDPASTQVKTLATPEQKRLVATTDKLDLASGEELPKTWTPVFIPEQTELDWKIITREVPAHYDARDFDPKIGDYTRREESKLIRMWQPVDPKAESRNLEEDEAEARRREPFHGEGCPTGMVRVKGRMKDFNIVDSIQNQTCRVGPDNKGWSPGSLCYRYELHDFEQNYEARIKQAHAAHQKTFEKDLDFCMDRYEYPNVRGQHPALMIDWFDARSVCEGEGKRLCSEDEWTFSCEGEEANPYPTGPVKDPTACNFDRVRKSRLDERTVMEFDSPAARKMIAGLYGGVPSGSMERCSSAFGVHDLTGNVDEWTTWTSPGRPRDMQGNDGRGWLSMLKGGFWGPVRNRCQPSTSAHEPGFRFYQQGFRCCSDSARSE